MTRKYLAIDIETAKDVPGPDFNWRPHRPLGIACIATLPVDVTEPTVWYGKTPDGAPAPQMSRHDCLAVLDYLSHMVGKGYTVLTWNGLAFDFDILSEESGAFETCRDMALNHVDMMFHVFCDRGFPVALDKAARAMGIPGKPSGMSGQLAPRLWAQGHHQEVLDYVAQDVRITLRVAQMCDGARSFSWVTRRGSVSTMDLTRGWLPVRDALRLPEPDTSWMDDPMHREGFIEWTKPFGHGTETGQQEYGDAFDPSKRILCSDGTCIGIVNDKGFCKVCGKPYRPESQSKRRTNWQTVYGGIESDQGFDPSKRILCSDGTCIGVVNDKGVCKVCGKPYRPESP